MCTLSVMIEKAGSVLGGTFWGSLGEYRKILVLLFSPHAASWLLKLLLEQELFVGAGRTGKEKAIFCFTLWEFWAHQWLPLGEVEKEESYPLPSCPFRVQLNDSLG